MDSMDHKLSEDQMAIYGHKQEYLSNTSTSGSRQQQYGIPRGKSSQSLGAEDVIDGEILKRQRVQEQQQNEEHQRVQSTKHTASSESPSTRKRRFSSLGDVGAAGGLLGPSSSSAQADADLYSTTVATAAAAVVGSTDNPQQQHLGDGGGGGGALTRVIKPAVNSVEWQKQRPDNQKEIERRRRDNHKEVERRRRENINSGINALARVVPNCDKNKGQILARSVEYIEQLKANETKNIEQWTMEKLLTEQALAEVAAQNDKLKQELEQAWKEVAAWKFKVAAQTKGQRNKAKDEVKKAKDEMNTAAAGRNSNNVRDK